MSLNSRRPLFRSIRRWAGICWLAFTALFIVHSFLRPFLVTGDDTAGFVAWQNVFFYGGLLAIVIWLLAVLTLWWTLGMTRWGIFAPKTWAADSLARFDNAVGYARLHDLRLVQVRRVYQRARRGTKCVVEHPDGTRQDAWFWHTSVRRGSALLVRSSNGYGPHTSHHQVMYVGSQVTGSGVVGRIPARAFRASRRRARRLRREHNKRLRETTAERG